MKARFDHLVLGVTNLEQAEKDFREQDFDVLDRKDASGPMHNRLVRFSDGSFIELVAFVEESNHRFAPRWSKGSGWIDYALNSYDFSSETDQLRRVAGQDAPRRSLSKLSQSVGKTWRLDLIEPGVGGFDAVLPFLIEEKTPSEWRLPYLPGDVMQPRGIAGISGVTVVTDDVEQSGPMLSALFGKPMEVVSRHGPGTMAILFTFGDNWVELVQPLSNVTAVATHIQQFGTGLYEAILRGTEELESLPVALKYGGKIGISSASGYPFF